MRRKYLGLLIFLCLFLNNFAFAYEIKDTENVEKYFIVPENSQDITYVIKSDLTLPYEYVKSYDVGEMTAIQVCDVGTNCEHKYSDNEEYVLNEIMSVTLPTCTEDGSMTVRCKYQIETSGLFGIGSNYKYCGNTETIVLKKTGHAISENSPDVCIRCGSNNLVHEAGDVWGADSEYHYKKCVIDGCSEAFNKELHTGGSHDNHGVCSTCKNVYQTHNMDVSKFSSDDNGHVYGCSYEGCQATFSESHEQGNAISWNKDTHWYACVKEECNKKINVENHVDDGSNEGVCAVCKRKYTGELESFKISNVKNGKYTFDEIGDNVKLNIEYTPDNLADTDFVWKIDDSQIASVTQDGVVTAKQEGKTVVRVFWHEEEVSCKIYVVNKLFEIKADDNSLVEGESTTVRVVTSDITDVVSWSVSNDEWAVISKKGKLTVNRGGDEVLTVYAQLPDGRIAYTEIEIEHGEMEEYEDESSHGKKCSVCGEKLEKHKLSGWEYDDSIHYKLCSNSKCSKSQKKYQINSHTSNLSCDVCGWKKDTSNETTGGNNSGTTGGNNTGITGGNNTGTTGGNNTGITGGNNTGITGGNTANTGQNSNSSGVTYHYAHNKREHWLVDSKGNIVKGSVERHTLPCSICGEQVINADTCKHDRGTYKVSTGKGTHSLYCKYCDAFLGTEACSSNCDCEKDGEEEIKADLEIPTKVYYVEEDITTEIEIFTTASSGYTFKWTMDTIANPNYNYKNASSSKYKEFKNGETSDDGTILFWYEDGIFKAKLRDSDIQELSEEVEVTITLISGNDEDTEKIKLVKNGPPSSRCLVYFEKNYISLENGKINLFIRTVYDDFSDAQICGKEGEFPLYSVKDGKITIKSGDEKLATVSKIFGLEKVANEKFNGYVAEVQINPKQVGNVAFDIELTTEYIFNERYAVVEKERKYQDSLAITQTEAEAQSQNTANPKEPADSSGSSSSGNTTGGSNVSTAALAGVGVIGLLLAAVVGSKMFNHK